MALLCAITAPIPRHFDRAAGEMFRLSLASDPLTLRRHYFSARAGVSEAEKRRGAAPKMGDPSFEEKSGDDLLSHPVSRAVPSALEGLTSGFGMEPGVTPPLWSPKTY